MFQFEGWIKKLFPEAAEAKEKLGDHNRDHAGELAFAAEAWGFLAGLLVGYKAGGVTRGTREVQRSFTIPRLDWERERIRDQEKNAAAGK
jgi:hypothetical protein